VLTLRFATTVPHRLGLAAPYNGEMGDWQQLLDRDPQICGGELCAKGTRIPVTVILDSLAEGSTVEAILKSYPSLRPEHVQASLAYAAELAHEERLLPLRAS
jgi:uncharacterized protein (DUF433 family)